MALDGDGDNSVYSGSLARHISTPDIDVIDMLKRVRKDVQDATNKEQLPWDSHAMIEDFFFRTSAGKVVTPQPDPDRDRKTPPKDQTAILIPPDRNAVRTGKPPVHPCDVIAGSASDPERVTPGVTMGALNGAEGVGRLPRGAGALSRYATLRISAGAFAAEVRRQRRIPPRSIAAWSSAAISPR